MARKCQLSKKRKLKANHVSHSNVKVGRFQKPNLQWKKFWLASENRWVRLRISTRMIRTILKNGLEKTLKDFPLS